MDGSIVFFRIRVKYRNSFRNRSRQVTGDSLLDGKSISGRSNRQIYYEQKKKFKNIHSLPMCSADVVLS